MKRLFTRFKCGILITIVLMGVVLNADTEERLKEISRLEKKLELKRNLENNLNDSIYPYSVALIVFCEEDVTGMGYSIGKDSDNNLIYLTGYGNCQKPSDDKRPMECMWEYCKKDTKYSKNGQLRLVKWHTQRFLLPDILPGLAKELPTHKIAAISNYCYDKAMNAYRPIVEYINEGHHDTLIAQKMCELSGTNPDTYKTNKKRSWLNGAVYCGFIQIDTLFHLQMAIQNNVQDLSKLFSDTNHTIPKYDDETIKYVLGNSWGTAKGTLMDELSQSELGQKMIDYMVNDSDIVPDFDDNIENYHTYAVMDWRILQKYGGVKLYGDLAELYYKSCKHKKLIDIASDIFSQKIDGKIYWEKDETMLQFARIKYFIGMSYYRQKDYENAAAKFVDGLNMNKAADSFDRELTVKIYYALGDVRKKLGGSEIANHTEAKRLKEGGDIDKSSIAKSVAEQKKKSGKKISGAKAVAYGPYVFRADCIRDEHGYGNPGVERYSYGVLRPHFGVDLTVMANDYVLSRVSGTIVAKRGTNGNKVIIKLKTGELCAYFYTGKSKPIGTKVSFGDTIAVCHYYLYYPNHSANMSHVHFEVRKSGSSYDCFSTYNRGSLQLNWVLNPYTFILGDDLETRMSKKHQDEIQKIFDNYIKNVKGCNTQILNFQYRIAN